MTRLALIPATLTAGPAFAHSAGHAHFHETDGMTLLLGFSLIGIGAGAAALMRVRKK
ncbi:hypothetical protein [Falsiphaeobacter marinintestinus]|uniref:hypothetical protein n=1 Tax=Falsiphaeobacter marinintestinus TaxID=1492905 RepID=UPI0016470A73|nr:hypothetical protein [Phaeobacter marinintestinus]